MKPQTLIAGVALTASIMGGIDSSVLNEQPISRVETVANERVEARQIGNVIETILPWKDQAGIKVKVDLGEPTLTERLSDKRKKEVITETVTDFDGGFKVDILLNEKPDTNVFCYNIEGAENYRFKKQSILTPEYIAQLEQEGFSNIEMPEAIQGSIAVYSKTLSGGIYKTGKVLHIPRPQVWSLSDIETKIWADITYSEKEGLCVNVPQNFLDTAQYPIRVDPTFGYTSIGGTSASTGNFYAGKFTAPENGNITSITAYTRTGAGTLTKIAALYSDSAGVPNTLLASYSSGISFNTSPAWIEIPMNSYSFTGSTVYWVAQGHSGASTIYWDESGVNNRYQFVSSSINYPTFPNPAESDTPFPRDLSIYATYSVSETSNKSSTLKGGVIIKGGATIK